MKIVITGAAGFIGSHLAERLAAKGHQVSGLDCYTDYYARWLKKLNADDVLAAGVKIEPLDLATADLWESVMDAEVVFHCAAQPGISGQTSYETYVRNNLTATYRLMEAVKNVKSLKCLVNMSTSSIYGTNATDSEDAPPRPTSYYGVTKLAAEQLALAYHREWKVPVCSLRLFSVYGPRERPEKLYPKLIGSIFGDRDFPLYGGSEDHLRGFTYIDDILDGCEAVLNNLDKCVGEIFNIGWDKEARTGDAIAIVEEIIGKKAKLVRTTPRHGDQIRTHANIEKARRVLGYEPRVSLREGLTAEVEWYKARVLPQMNERSGLL
jgi:UDP-glucuronate 4-epimerase